ncbi:hypothetical protein DUI87_09072 [Hirundo rustica rustica]|uniref:Reverse transcriptase domain-containing protein n=1 Tax=Hirundo rustica rustica TaxID=333673 RepID=A0A3M0KL63_HIRRU|nr:hypothetical protein DUI87_09072 [Hirundo rustica rustica]
MRLRPRLRGELFQFTEECSPYENLLPLDKAEDCREALRRDLDKIEGWKITNCIKFDKVKCWILHLGKGNPGYTVLFLESSHRIPTFKLVTKLVELRYGSYLAPTKKFNSYILIIVLYLYLEFSRGLCENWKTSSGVQLDTWVSNACISKFGGVYWPESLLSEGASFRLCLVHLSLLALHDKDSLK